MEKFEEELARLLEEHGYGAVIFDTLLVSKDFGGLIG